MHSVVSISDATEAAFCSAVRVTLVGSEDAHLEHVAVGVVGGVEAEVALALEHLVDHDGGSPPALATISRSGCFDGAQTILMPASWSWLSPLRRHGGAGTQQRDAAAGHDAFLDGGTGGVQRVFDAGLLLLHLDFGGGTDLDDGHAAGQLGHALLQLSRS